MLLPRLFNFINGHLDVLFFDQPEDIPFTSIDKFQEYQAGAELVDCLIQVFRGINVRIGGNPIVLVYGQKGLTGFPMIGQLDLNPA